MINKFFSLSFNNILHRKTRSILTIIGIVIGIMAIVALITISGSLKSTINDQFDKIGKNRLYVTPRTTNILAVTAGLTTDDINTLEKLSEFKWITPYLMESATIEFNNERKKLTVHGTPTDKIEERWEDLDIDIDEGRTFSGKEEFYAIIGTNIAKETFDKKVRLNDNLIINENKFRVIGIFEEIGNPEDDNIIQIPIETAREVFNKKDAASIIELITKPGVDLDTAAIKAQNALIRSRGEKFSDAKNNKLSFEIITPEQLVGQFNNILLIVQIVLISIAAISLIVGSVGIMNSMYTNVLERTKEIGVMKAVGAKREEILKIFIIESAIMGFIGGVIGITLGILLAKGFGSIAAVSG